MSFCVIAGKSNLTPGTFIVFLLPIFAVFKTLQTMSLSLISIISNSKAPSSTNKVDPTVTSLYNSL
ncbi:hypothetical protein D3C87_1983790 [compost metagenome]